MRRIRLERRAISARQKIKQLHNPLAHSPQRKIYARGAGGQARREGRQQGREHSVDAVKAQSRRAAQNQRVAG